jgi:GTP-binding protein
MKELSAELIISAADEKQFPKSDLPEIAFTGRSNVGKSSLLNSIVLRKNLAHISSAPGKTRQINFYNVEKNWVFADLPGFGYATISKDVRITWQKLNMVYLSSRQNLRLVACLIDSRHDPMEHDLGFMEWLENNEKKYVVILTKCDKLSKKAVEERKQQLLDYLKLSENCVDVLPYSTVTGLGRTELLAIIKRELKK